MNLVHNCSLGAATAHTYEMVKKSEARATDDDDDDDDDDDALLNLAAQELKRYIKRYATAWLVGYCGGR